MAPSKNLPVTIPIPGEAATASYSWTDIASGLGYVKYYMNVMAVNGGIDSETGPTDLLLATTQIIAESNTVGYWQFELGSATAEFDWDTSIFNLPRYVEGTAYLEYSWDPDTAGIKFKAAIYHVASDGTTETLISDEVNSFSHTSLAKGAMPIVINGTNIGIGEKLRLKISGLSTNANNFLKIYQGNSSYQAQIHIPFRIDI